MSGEKWIAAALAALCERMPPEVLAQVVGQMTHEEWSGVVDGITEARKLLGR